MNALKILIPTVALLLGLPSQSNCTPVNPKFVSMWSIFQDTDSKNEKYCAMLQEISGRGTFSITIVPKTGEVFMVMTGPGWNLKPGDKSHMIIRFPEQANIEISGINSQKGIKSAISWKDLGDFLMEIKHSKYAQIDFMVSYQPWDLSAGDIANAFSAMRACTQEIK